MRARLVPVLLGLLVLSSCRLQLDTIVTVHEDGSGTVQVVVGLDADAMERIGGDLGAELSVADLTAAGWSVTDPVLDDDGFTRVALTHPTGSPGEATGVLQSLSGPAGPLQQLRVTRHTTFAGDEWSFTGRIDFSGGVEGFGDSALAEELDGLPVGQTAAEIEAELGEPLEEVIQVRVDVRLPGTVESNALASGGDRAVWQVGFGERSVAMEATGRERRVGTLVAAGAAVACGLGLVISGAVALVRRGRRRRAT